MQISPSYTVAPPAPTEINKKKTNKKAKAEVGRRVWSVELCWSERIPALEAGAGKTSLLYFRKQRGHGEDWSAEEGQRAPDCLRLSACCWWRSSSSPARQDGLCVIPQPGVCVCAVTLTSASNSYLEELLYLHLEEHDLLWSPLEVN